MAPSGATNHGLRLPRRQFAGVSSIIFLLFLAVVYLASPTAAGKAGFQFEDGPGGWFNYLLPQITSLGFSKETYQAIVDGALLSIQRAHESLEEGYLDVSTAERASDNKNIGVLTWLPVHGTSLLGNNTHIAGDNKGVAAWLLESEMESDDSAAEGFVAGFSQANVGDATPNTLGAFCDDGSGDECSAENSTCADGLSQSCHGRGPEFRKLDLGVSSCYEIGRRQYAGAKEAYDSIGTSSTPVVGSTVKSFHFYHNMTFWEFKLPDGSTGKTCPAALGYSFAAGTSDWPGFFDFTQGDSDDPDASPLWAAVSGLLKTPSAEQKKCHGSKPILLDVGEMTEPYPWTPNIVDIQVLRAGQLVLIISPSEATTMSGRRWRNAVAEEAASFLDEDPIVILGGPGNTYAHYVATPEEYEVQRYEGASTLFGPHELDAYINLTVSNLGYLAPSSNEVPDQGTLAPDNRDDSLSFITGVVYDTAPIGTSFGKVLKQPDSKYSLGDVVKVTFRAANPRNNLRLEGTFAAIEQKIDGEWTEVRDDADWFLVYTWRRTNWLLGYSEVDITWETSGNAAKGTFRVKYYGDSKNILGSISAFTGTSQEFVLS
ncbi:hypothetical protein G7Z17_g3226 [Cylindrodendrum hubeiense]|uniref:Neutral ceramidase n=1 Tax=Cylindrodendrum hubeiense TaxID=595255 RepID=A0A9P5HBA8_9HYPO|nr:hypothetical protein G7Z17_g3226 [Cylindrodendrum hubeiense]